MTIELRPKGWLNGTGRAKVLGGKGTASIAGEIVWDGEAQQERRPKKKRLGTIPCWPGKRALIWSLGHGVWEESFKGRFSFANERACCWVADILKMLGS